MGILILSVFALVCCVLFLQALLAAKPSRKAVPVPVSRMKKFR